MRRALTFVSSAIIVFFHTGNEMMIWSKETSEPNLTRTKSACRFAVTVLVSWMLCALFIYLSASRMGPIPARSYLLLPVFSIFALFYWVDEMALSIKIISILTLVGAILLPLLNVMVLRSRIVAITLISHLAIIVYFLWTLVLLFSLWT